MSRRPRDTASARSHTNLRPLAIAFAIAFAIAIAIAIALLYLLLDISLLIGGCEGLELHIATKPEHPLRWHCPTLTLS